MEESSQSESSGKEHEHSPETEDASKHRSPPGLHSWLLGRELFGRSRGSPFSCAPPRLCFPIEDVLDAAGLMVRGILLGLSATGDQLFSYSQTNGKYFLHVWLYSLKEKQRAVLLSTVPLFSEAGDDQRNASASAFADGAEVPLRISVLQPPGGRLLLIHGERPGEAAFNDSEEAENANTNGAAGDEDDELTRRCFVTAVPAPWLWVGCPLHATNWSYLGSPGAPFDALLQIHTTAEGATLLLLPSVDGLLAVCVSPPETSGDCAVDTPTGLEGCSTAPVAWAAHAASQHAPDGVAAPVCARVSVSARFDAEKFIRRTMAAALSQGWRLADLHASLAGYSPFPACQPTALVHVLATLRRAPQKFGQPSQVGPLHTPAPAAVPPPSAGRVVELLALVALGGASSGGSRLLRSADVTTCCPAPAAPSSLSGVAALRVPPLRAAVQPYPGLRAGDPRLPHALSNDSVLQAWLSADVLTHPSLPVAILGFGRGGAPEEEREDYVS